MEASDPWPTTPWFRSEEGLDPGEPDIKPRATLLRFCVSLLLLFALIPAGTAQAQTNSSYAFTNFVGRAGGVGNSDGTGTAARFARPSGVAVDTMGTVFVADTENHTIRRLTPEGVVTTLAGKAGASGSADGTGTDARFSFPSAVAVDTAGNLFVADTGNNLIRKVTPEGLVTTVAGPRGARSGNTPGKGAVLLNQPSGLALDSAGNVYVADTGNHTIRKLTPDGEVTTLAGVAGVEGATDGVGLNAQFSSPVGLAVDAKGNVYVADSNNDTIRKLTPEGVVTKLAGTTRDPGSDDATGGAARFSLPYGVAVDGAGTVFVADSANSTIRTVTPEGVVATLAGSPGVGGSADGPGSQARFQLPRAVAVDAAGNVWVADTENHMVRKITAEKIVSTLAGSAVAKGAVDAVGSAARFYRPVGVAVDASGNVFVADSYNNTIRKTTPDGIVQTLAGNPSAWGSDDGIGNQALFASPAGVAVDSKGNVFVADTANHTIRMVTPEGAVSTLAGSPEAEGSVDGTGGEARFFGPTGVAVDGFGTVFVADSVNGTIRKVTAEGVVTTLAGMARAFGSVDGPGTLARFLSPRAVAVDTNGNVLVADYLNHTIRKVTPEGVVTTLAGSPGAAGTADGPGGAARFNGPSGVAVDSAGNVLVTDALSHTIRSVSPQGVVTTLAGSPGNSGSGDGLGLNARFNGPAGLAVDAADNLYEADRSSNCITKGTPIYPPALGAFFDGTSLQLSWPMSYLGWELQATRSGGLDWLPVPGSTTTTHLAIPLDLGSPPVLYRLRLTKPGKRVD